jgi:NADH-quinone oxidoreductase subunit A
MPTESILMEYLPLILMLVVGAVVGIQFTLFSEWLGAKRFTKEKQTTYESGMIPYGSASDRFSIKFYLTAVSFLVFDIEVVFIYPWAIQLRELGMQGFIAMSIFILVLLIGLFYEIKKGGLKWD